MHVRRGAWLQLEMHTDNLHKMLSTGTLEVALRNSSKLQTLQNQAADRPPLDEPDPDEAIPASALTESERAEATGTDVALMSVETSCHTGFVCARRLARA